MSRLWMIVTSMPCLISPFAASKPKRPPPITTACVFLVAASSIRLTSAISLKAITPFSSWPGNGMIKGVEPVASNSRV